MHACQHGLTCSSAHSRKMQSCVRTLACSHMQACVHCWYSHPMTCYLQVGVPGHQAGPQHVPAPQRISLLCRLSLGNLTKPVGKEGLEGYQQEAGLPLPLALHKKGCLLLHSTVQSVISVTVFSVAACSSAQWLAHSLNHPFTQPLV